jgi:hypothetical protein
MTALPPCGQIRAFPPAGPLSVRVEARGAARVLRIVECADGTSGGGGKGAWQSQVSGAVVTPAPVLLSV